MAELKAMLGKPNAFTNNVFSQSQAHTPQHNNALPQQQAQGTWDAWGNWQSTDKKPVWKINRANTEGLFNFDGSLAD